MNLLGFMVCVPVHCYELVIGFECSISSTCLPQENTDRVQREWACTECRGSGHVVSAEGVGMYRVQREWACTDSETGHQMRRCLAMP